MRKLINSQRYFIFRAMRHREREKRNQMNDLNERIKCGSVCVCNVIRFAASLDIINFNFQCSRNT